MIINWSFVISIFFIAYTFFNTSLVIGLILGIIIFSVLWAIFNLFFGDVAKESNKKDNNNLRNKTYYYSGEKITTGMGEEENKRLIIAINNLRNENLGLREKIEDLTHKLNNYYEQLKSIKVNESFYQKEHPVNFYRAEIENNIERVREPEIINSNRIRVSLTFEDKKGTVKGDESGDIYLERINDKQFELKSDKEIYGTAIHLEQLQYNYKILNPDKANNKPMRVTKKPLYSFDSSMNKGNLEQKGEVEYQ